VHGLRVIKVHHLRHTTATLLKNLGVPARDAQLILGHSRPAVTQEIYTHEDRQAQHDALAKLGDASAD
jgi:integrase